jgi:hypothetical protein
MQFLRLRYRVLCCLHPGRRKCKPDALKCVWLGSVSIGSVRFCLSGCWVGEHASNLWGSEMWFMRYTGQAKKKTRTGFAVI